MTMTISEALAEFDAHMQAIGGCSDGGCVIVKPNGMHTNGGCKCPRDHIKMQRMSYAANRLRDELKAAIVAALGDGT